MKATILFFLSIAAVVCWSAPEPLINPKGVEHNKKSSEMSQLKKSDAWINMGTQLDQYTNHLSQYTNYNEQLNVLIVTATNKISLVSDAPTKLALTKVQNEIEKQQQMIEKQQKMIDDLHDALNKIKKIVIDSVNIDNP